MAEKLRKVVLVLSHYSTAKCFRVNQIKVGRHAGASAVRRKFSRRKEEEGRRK